MIGGIILIIATVLYAAFKENNSEAQGITIAGIVIGIFFVIMSLVSGDASSASSSYMFGQFVSGFVIVAFIGFLICVFSSKK